MKIVAEPKLEIEFTKLQLDALYMVCERHYCYTVKSLWSKANRSNCDVNGVLTIALHFHENTNEAYITRLSFRHIDLMMKAMEMSSVVLRMNHPQHYEALKKLSMDFQKAMVEMNIMSRLTTKEL